MRFYLAAAGLLGGLAVAAGAFTSHGLETTLTNQGTDIGAIPERLRWAETATHYLLVHSAALLACAAAGLALPRARLLAWTCAAFLLGMLAFSGSLFLLAITGNETFARIAPWGGTTLMVAWGMVALTGFFLPSHS